MIDAGPTLLRAADYRRVRWKNGGGWTSEVASEPAGLDASSLGNALRWRVSIAEIEQDGRFSTFPGIDRELLLLDGAGMDLTIDNEPRRRLTGHLQGLRFRGEQRVHCRLLDGPTRDFNIMVRRGIGVCRVRCDQLSGTARFDFSDDCDWLLHLVAGSCELSADDRDPTTLGAGDSLLQRRGSQHRSVALNGAGDLIVVRFGPAAA